MSAAKNWEPVFSTSNDLLGSTAFCLSGNIYIVGGAPAGPPSAHHLQVQCFDPVAVKHINIAVNSSGASNRSYHSAIEMPGYVLLLGGELSDGSPATGIVRCSIGDEGFSSTILSPNGISRKGMSGISVGPDGGQIGVLFGGCAQNQYFDDVVLVKPGTVAGTCELQPVPLTGEKPVARAFAACCVCGENNQYVVISGGFDGRNVLDDLWILDTTKSIPSLNAEESITTKSGKAGKNVIVEEALKWTKVQINLPAKRFKHSCYSYKQSDDTWRIGVVGGINRSGMLSCTPVEFTVAAVGSSPPKECGECTCLSNLDIFAHRYGGIVSTVTKDSDIVGAFLFCGISADGNSDTGFICFDEGSEATQQIRAIIQDRKLQTEAKEAAAREDAVLEDASATSIVFHNGDRYEGEVFRGGETNDVPHGVGTMKYANGACYEGAWELGVKKGEGRLTSADGNVFSGSFSHDDFNGSGIYTIAASGEEFHGNFINNSLEGQGVWHDKAGNSYEGEFVRSVKHGFGTLFSRSTFPDGSDRNVLYTGEWVDGQPSGLGTLHLIVEAEGTGGLMISARYEGTVLDGLPNGTGTCFYSDGSHYEGQWRRKLRNGFGKYTSSSGDEYAGKWVAGKRCGKGVWKSYRGDCYDGHWEEDVPHGTGEYRYASGAIFKGEWIQGKCEGVGKMIYADFSEYSGQWKRGTWHGHGTWRGPARSDGEVTYSGDWVDGVRSGQGTAVYSSGDKYTGRFVNDRPGSSSTAKQ